MSKSTRQWLIGYGIYLVAFVIAIIIMYASGLPAYSTPILIIFLLGYLVGRITKGMER